MLSFKLKKKNHDRVSWVSGKLCLLGYVGAVLVFGYGGFSNYFEARGILSDHTVVAAQMDLADVSETYNRRSGTRLMYHFRYSFEVDGKNYEGGFSASESNADRFLGLGTVDVAFSNAGRGFDRLEKLERHDSFFGVLWTTVLSIVLLGFLALFIHGYTTLKLFVLREEDREPEEADAAEGPEMQARA